MTHRYAKATHDSGEIVALFDATVVETPEGWAEHTALVEEVTDVRLIDLNILGVDLTSREIANLPKRLLAAINRLADELEFAND